MVSCIHMHTAVVVHILNKRNWFTQLMLTIDTINACSMLTNKTKQIRAIRKYKQTHVNISSARLA